MLYLFILFSLTAKAKNMINTYLSQWDKKNKTFSGLNTIKNTTQQGWKIDKRSKTK